METRSQLFSKAQAACDAGDVVNAQRTCSIYQQHFGEDAGILYLSGRTYINLGQYAKAVEVLEQSFQQTKSDLTLVYLLIAASHSFNRFLVMQYATEINLDAIENDELLLQLGHSFAVMNLYDQAHAAFSRYSEKSPHNAKGYFHSGLMMLKQGKHEDATNLFLQAVICDPEHVHAQHALSITNPDYFDEAGLANLCAYFEYAQQSGAYETSVVLAHTLDRIYSHKGSFNKAEDILLQAKNVFLGKAEKFEARNAAIFDWLLEGKRESCSGSLGNASTQPIFIVGLPETGLDIVAQSLSACSEVATPIETNLFSLAVNQLCSGKNRTFLNIKAMLAAEQLDNQLLGEHYLQLADGLKSDKHKYTLDVQPLNFFNVSLIKRALPNAKVIIMLRDPVESVLLNYSSLQVPFNQSNANSYDLTLSCRYYRHFYNLILRWQSIFGDAIRVQSYTDLERNFDSEVKALFDYCGLQQNEINAQELQSRLLPVKQQMKNAEPVRHYSRFAKTVRKNLADILPG